MICAMCMSMFLGTGKGKHHTTIDNLEKAVDNGCYICFHLIDYLRLLKKCPSAGQASLKYDFTGAGLTIFVGPHGQSLKIHFSRSDVDIEQQKGVAFDQYVQSVKRDLVNSDPSAVRDNSLQASNLQQNSTGGFQSMNYARSLFENCQRNHQRCHQTAQAVYQIQEDLAEEPWHPKRLIDCSPKDGALHLIHGSDRVPSKGFATLSYCWGTLKFFNLTLDRDKEIMDGRVSLDELPLTFREAIQVCNELNIKYLWIDSICIVQSGDGGDDWVFHAREMSRIYSAGLLNIAAEHVSNPNEGLFAQRHLRELIAMPSDTDMFGDQIRAAMQLSASCHEVDTDGEQIPDAIDQIYELRCFCAEEPSKHIENTRLCARGWVLQERLLSPRTLHFTRHRIAWTCYSHLAGERCTERVTNGTSSRRLHQDIMYCSVSDGYSNATQNRQEVWTWWDDLIWEYNRRQLSFPGKDKLVALAGIVNVFNKERKLEYLAGMFRITLHWSLLWKPNTVRACEAERDLERERKSWTGCTRGVPSWSWASMDATVCLPESVRFFVGATAVPLIRVTDAKVDLHDSRNPYGQVEGGILFLAGFVVSEQEINVLSKVYMATDDGRYTRRGCGLWYLPTIELPEPSLRAAVYGLLLQRDCQQEDHSWSYYRVGTFRVEATEHLSAALQTPGRRSKVVLV